MTERVSIGKPNTMPISLKESENLSTRMENGGITIPIIDCITKTPSGQDANDLDLE